MSAPRHATSICCSTLPPLRLAPPALVDAGMIPIMCGGNRAALCSSSLQASHALAPIGLSSFDGRFEYGRIVYWKADRPKRILGTCPNRVIDLVGAARFMTAASTLQRLARSAALNVPCAARPSRIGTPLGCLDIGSSPVQLRIRMTATPKNAPRESNELAKSIY